MRHTFLVVTVKRWLKSVYIYGSYRKTGVPLFWTTLYLLLSFSRANGNLVQGNTPKFGGVLFRQKTRYTSETGKIGQRLLLITNRSRKRAFDWCQNQRPWMTIVSKHVRISEPTTKIGMKIDPYCQRRRCSPMTLDFGKAYAEIRRCSLERGRHTAVG